MKTKLVQAIKKFFIRLSRTPSRLFLRRSTSSGDLSFLYPHINFTGLESMLQHRIRNRSFFAQALVHRSYLSTAEKVPCDSNERLEFLGDAVLGVVVAEYLYHAYPKGSEGELTVLRSRLVNRKALAYYARELDLWKYLLVNLNPIHAGEKGSDTILADAFEAIVAALYLDGGLESARGFIHSRVDAALSEGFLEERANFKSALLELSQSQGNGIPRYSLVKEEGPDHDRTFTIQVLIQNTPLGTGVGKNKKEAEQAAAEQALQALKEETLPDPAADPLILTTKQ
ncbi:MAG TPA: ribonuclease III [Bacteroidota bacterium]|nr:ribonuclease III [Bacteroidota bacterium]